MDTIRQLREAKAWTQEHLAEISGLSTRTIQRAEAGGQTGADTLLALAAAFDVAPEELRQGPHIILEAEGKYDHLQRPWPGLRLAVCKDHNVVGLVTHINSRTRRFTRKTLFMVDHPHDDQDVVTYDEEAHNFVVNGEPWVDSVVEDSYDTVLVCGSRKDILRHKDQIPKHWVIIPDLPKGEPFLLDTEGMTQMQVGEAIAEQFLKHIDDEDFHLQLA